MFGRTSLLKATALALPFSLAAAAAEAASIAETVQQHEELSTFTKAMAAAKFDQQLSGEGPYTVFVPTDQAFEQLPKGALDELMKQENQAQLTSLLEFHVVEGQAISAKDMLGQRSQLDAMSGDALSVDGSSQVVLLAPAQGAGQEEGQPAAASTPTAQGSDMPMTEHQQQALESHPAQGQRQTATEGAADMPATEHQQQVLRDQSGQGQGQTQAQGQGQMQGQGGQETAASTPTAQGSDMPMTEHQQQALESHPAQGQRQTAAEGAADMPATEHQQQVLQNQPGQAQGQQQTQGDGKPGVLRGATVVGAEIEADNGVIHVIDAVLLPQDVVKMLEASKQG